MGFKNAFSKIVESNEVDYVNNLDTIDSVDSSDQKKSSDQYTYEELWNMKNPETGLRYDIPMLDFSDPLYKLRYISYMKMKIDQPKEFERMLQWN